jgi:hypothetical protein
MKNPVRAAVRCLVFVVSLAPPSQMIAQSPSPTTTPTPVFGRCDDGCNGQPCGPLRADGSPTAQCLNFDGACHCIATCNAPGQPCGPPCPDGSPMGTCFCEFTCACISSGCAPSVCAQCSCNGDRNGDGQVTVDEVVDAANNALHGCPPSTPVPQIEGVCSIGSCSGSGFPTTQSFCCYYARHTEIALAVLWCPRDQLDPVTGQCRACTDPCAGLPPVADFAPKTSSGVSGGEVVNSANTNAAR